MGKKSQWMVADPIEYKLLKANAKENRKKMTDAENAFWLLVKNNALGERCLRQFVIGDYIVDFLFRRSKVIVEIDGGYHNNENQKLADDIRTEWLKQMGYRVIRFTNEDVLFNEVDMINKLKTSLGGSEKSSLNREDVGGSFL